MEDLLIKNLAEPFREVHEMVVTVGMAGPQVISVVSDRWNELLASQASNQDVKHILSIIKQLDLVPQSTITDWAAAVLCRRRAPPAVDARAGTVASAGPSVSGGEVDIIQARRGIAGHTAQFVFALLYLALGWVVIIMLTKHVVLTRMRAHRISHRKECRHASQWCSCGKRWHK